MESTNHGGVQLACTDRLKLIVTVTVDGRGVHHNEQFLERLVKILRQTLFLNGDSKAQVIHFLIIWESARPLKVWHSEAFAGCLQPQEAPCLDIYSF